MTGEPITPEEYRRLEQITEDAMYARRWNIPTCTWPDHTSWCAGCGKYRAQTNSRYCMVCDPSAVLTAAADEFKTRLDRDGL